MQLDAVELGQQHEDVDKLQSCNNGLAMSLILFIRDSSKLFCV
jgi:hypothetical protein